MQLLSFFQISEMNSNITIEPIVIEPILHTQIV